MTTVAWDGCTLAADTRITEGTLIQRGQKLFRLSDGRLFGGAGDLESIHVVVEYLESEADDKPDGLENFTALLIDTDGRAWRLESRLVPMPVLGPYAAIGSGQPYALMAMELGRSAREAVELGCRVDAQGGLPVEDLRLTAQAEAA